MRVTKLCSQYVLRALFASFIIGYTGNLAIAQQNGVLREVWANLEGSGIEKLIESPNYPQAPTLKDVLPGFASPANFTSNYGTRLRAYLKPSASGEYSFWIQGDDNCILYFGRDGTPDSATLDKDYANVMEKAFADISNSAIKNADTFNEAISTANEFEMLPDSSLGRQLRMVAKTIQSRQALGQRRQVFFVATGGFDTHGPQLDSHAGLLGGLDSAIKGFHEALGSIEAQDCVTSFTASDFGRTFDTNGRGSDHGWGGHHLVMGGAVNGQQIYGDFPDINFGSAQDTGRGRWLPTTSVDQYGATIARWFGIYETELPTVFPNIGNFATSNLGFMG